MHKECLAYLKQYNDFFKKIPYIAQSLCLWEEIH